MKRADELNFELARAAVAQLAPAELPVLDGLGLDFIEAASAPRAGDGALGFDVQQLTFAVVASQCAVASGAVIMKFFESLASESATSAAKGIANALKKRRGAPTTGGPRAAAPRLDPGQLAAVRKTAFDKAQQSGLSEAQAGLMADALIGSLSTM
jgi:hypothetical protein